MIKVLASYILYAVGDVISKIMEKGDYWSLYKVYNWFMITSIYLQNGSKFGPWKN